jgi:hypothetical protein
MQMEELMEEWEEHLPKIIKLQNRMRGFLGWKKMLAMARERRRIVGGCASKHDHDMTNVGVVRVL